MPPRPAAFAPREAALSLLSPVVITAPAARRPVPGNGYVPSPRHRRPIGFKVRCARASGEQGQSHCRAAAEPENLRELFSSYGAFAPFFFNGM